MMGKLIWSIIWALVGVFVINVSILITVLSTTLSELWFWPVILSSWVISFVLGAALLFVSIKTKVGGELKKFLLLTGASAMGLPIGVFAGIAAALTSDSDPLAVLFIATFMCSLGFLVGVVGTIVLTIKNKPSLPAGTS